MPRNKLSLYQKKAIIKVLILEFLILASLYLFEKTHIAFWGILIIVGILWFETIVRYLATNQREIWEKRNGRSYYN